MEKYSSKLAAALALAVAFVLISPSKEISAQISPLVTSEKIEADWFHQEELLRELRQRMTPLLAE